MVIGLKYKTKVSDSPETTFRKASHEISLNNELLSTLSFFFFFFFFLKNPQPVIEGDY